MADPFTLAILGTASTGGFAAGGASAAVMGAMAAGTALTAGGAIQSGNAQRKASNFQATQMRQQAGQEMAAAEVQAQEHRRQAQLQQSRVQAVSAASGGSSDVSVLNILGDIGNVGEYNALAAMYAGQEKATGLNTGANVQVIEGRQAAKAGKISAAGTLLSGAAQMGQYQSMYAKYNPTASKIPAPYTGLKPFAYL
jgi:hypothetical protein